MSSLFSDAVVLNTSQIEFVVVGPLAGNNKLRTGVIVRSENAQIDLVGFAATGQTEFSAPSSPLGLLGMTSRSMNAVGSFPLAPNDMDSDERSIGYWFAWVGECSEKAKREINHVFKLYAADLQNGIMSPRPESVEWSLAPVLFLCAAADLRERRAARSQFIFIVVATLFVLFAVAVTILFAPPPVKL